jgi:hypothetical protein
MYTRVHKIVPAAMMRMGRHDYCKKFRAGAYADAQLIDDFKVEVIRQEGSSGILIWNPKEPCVQIVVHDGDTTASLVWVGYDPACTVNGNMPRGTGTQRMLNLAFRLAKQHGATHIELMDDAKIDCHDKKIDLSPMYFLQHGATWYESKFGFQPREEFIEEYAEMKRNWKALDSSFFRAQPCEYFTRQTVRPILRQIEGDRDIFYRLSWVKKL